MNSGSAAGGGGLIALRRAALNSRERPIELLENWVGTGLLFDFMYVSSVPERVTPSGVDVQQNFDTKIRDWRERSPMRTNVVSGPLAWVRN